MKVFIGPYPEGDETRKVEIEVHPYDSWNVDTTLSPIIFAVLTEFVKEVPSTAMVDKEDVPESLHREIKAQCAMRGAKIADEVRELLLQKYGKA